MASGNLPADTLSAHERDQLAACEAVVEAGLNTFYDVGAALLTIRDKRLYRESHKAFDVYCRERWGFSRQRAHQLIEASEVIGNLSTIVDKPANEGQVRELAAVSDPDTQRVVWDFAQKTAPVGPDGTPQVTAQHVKSLASVAKGVLAAGAIDDGSGAMVSWDDLDANKKRALLEANLSEETYERHQRQREHLTRVLKSSKSPEWYTPDRYVSAAREVLGAIDLDPASCDVANETVRATRYYQADDDGLQHSWKGRVWLNPPYGGQSGPFTAKLLEEYRAGRVTAAVLLVNSNSTDADWFQPLWEYLLCFTNHRINFVSPAGETSGSTHGSVFAYLGPDREGFARQFSGFGAVVARWNA